MGVATSANTVEIYDIRARKLQQLYNAHEAPVNSLAFHPSGNYLVSGANDNKIKIYDLLQARVIYTLSGEKCLSWNHEIISSILGHENKVNAVAFSPRGEYCVTGGNDNRILVWKMNLEVEGEVVKEKVVQEVTNSNTVLKSHSKIPMKNLDDDLARLELDNKENNDNNYSEVLRELRSTNKKLETLTNTVLLMERRLCLVEDQIKLISNNQSK